MVPLGFSPVDFAWSLLGVCFLLAVCVHRSSDKLPIQIEQLFEDLIRYGKTKQTKRPGWLRAFDVPKRWFSHFYAVSCIWNGFLLTLSVHAAVTARPFPSWLTYILEYLSGKSKDGYNGPNFSVLLMLVLLWVHSCRRLLECLYVSVFSDGVIHIVQYAFGLTYYIFLGLTVLCVDLSQTDGDPAHKVWAELRGFHLAGSALFFWASGLQHVSLRGLASLRKRESGAVETLGHRMPHGGWFEWVSCPHYLAEVLVYTALGVCVGGCSLTWWLVQLYVLSNQMLAALLCHQFYTARFPTYPTQRKALIPFVL